MLHSVLDVPSIDISTGSVGDHVCFRTTRSKAATLPHPFTPCSSYEVVGINQKKMMSFR